MLAVTAVLLMPTLCTQMVTRFVTNVTTAQAVMAQHPTTLQNVRCRTQGSSYPIGFTED